jgi:G:T-mismatch repair DNA endonuclease (very short patch repair protein)
LARKSDEFAKIYNHRTAVERSINSLKDMLGVSNRKTSNVLTTKADLFLAGIVQPVCVVLAHKLHDVKLARSPRKLIA